MSNFKMLLAYEEEEDQGDKPAMDYTPETAVHPTYSTSQVQINKCKSWMVLFSSDYGLGRHFGFEAMSMEVIISDFIEPYRYCFFIIPYHCELWDSGKR